MREKAINDFKLMTKSDAPDFIDSDEEFVYKYIPETKNTYFLSTSVGITKTPIWVTLWVQDYPIKRWEVGLYSYESILLGRHFGQAQGQIKWIENRERYMKGK